MKAFLLNYFQNTAAAVFMYVVLSLVIAFITWDITWLYLHEDFFVAARIILGLVFVVTLIEFILKKKDTDDKQ